MLIKCTQETLSAHPSALHYLLRDGHIETNLTPIRASYSRWKHEMWLPSAASCKTISVALGKHTTQTLWMWSHNRETDPHLLVARCWLGKTKGVGEEVAFGKCVTRSQSILSWDWIRDNVLFFFLPHFLLSPQIVDLRMCKIHIYALGALQSPSHQHIQTSFSVTGVRDGPLAAAAKAVVMVPAMWGAMMERLGWHRFSTVGSASSAAIVSGCAIQELRKGEREKERGGALGRKERRECCNAWWVQARCHQRKHWWLTG